MPPKPKQLEKTRQLSVDDREQFRKIRQEQGVKAARKWRNQRLNQGYDPGTELSGGGTVPYKWKDANKGAADAAGKTIQQIQDRDPFSAEGLPQLPGQEDLYAFRQQTEDKLMEEFDRRNNERYMKEDEIFRQRMASQGRSENDPRYQELWEQHKQRQGDERLSYATRATELGGNEMSRMYGIGADTRGRLFGERATEYRMPMEQLSAFNPYLAARTSKQMQNRGFGNQAEADARLFEHQKWMQQNAYHPPVFAPPDPFALAGYQNELAMQRDAQNYQQQQDLYSQQQPSFGDQAAAIGGQIAGGIAQGAASSWFL